MTILSNSKLLSVIALSVALLITTSTQQVRGQLTPAYDSDTGVFQSTTATFTGGPYIGQSIAAVLEHTNNVVGVLSPNGGNLQIRVLDPTTGNLLAYRSDGFYFGDFGWNSFNGGEYNGQTIAALSAAGNVLGVLGGSAGLTHINVLSAGGSVLWYNTDGGTNGAYGGDYGWTTFTGGGLAGQTLATVVAAGNVIGTSFDETNMMIKVLNTATGTMLWYDITNGTYGADHGWTTLSGGGQEDTRTLADVVATGEYLGVLSTTAGGASSLFVTPEPSAVLLSVLGLGLLVVRRKRSC